MSKIEIDASRTNVKISAEGAVAVVIGSVLSFAAVFVAYLCLA